jgi:hypothetical protein
MRATADLRMKLDIGTDDIIGDFWSESYLHFPSFTLKKWRPRV